MSVCVASSISNFRCRTCLLYLPYLHAKFQVQRPLHFREREVLPIAIAEERNKNTENIRVRGSSPLGIDAYSPRTKQLSCPLW